jgi:hypothetical protein
MKPRQVQLSLHPGKILAWASLAGLISASSFWIFGANASHLQTSENTEEISETGESVEDVETAIKLLTEQQLIWQKVWGDAHEKRVHEILNREGSYERRRDAADAHP